MFYKLKLTINSLNQFKSNNMRNILGLLLILFLSLQTLKAQIGQSRNDIIKEYGYNYTTGTTDDGHEYIEYKKDVNTNASGNYTEYNVYYFEKTDDGREFCYFRRRIEPSSETNIDVAYLKSKFVEIGTMRWKDYENNIIYDIVVKDGFCTTTVSRGQ